MVFRFFWENFIFFGLRKFFEKIKKYFFLILLGYKNKKIILLGYKKIKIKKNWFCYLRIIISIGMVFRFFWENFIFFGLRKFFEKIKKIFFFNSAGLQKKKIILLGYKKIKIKKKLIWLFKNYNIDWYGFSIFLREFHFFWT